VEQIAFHAEDSAEKALALNPEETGSLLVLGEIALARGDLGLADQRFTLACRTNPKAVGGMYLRAYIAWKRGEAAQARELLLAAHAARGKEWKPKGSAMEGDVQRRMHVDGTLFSQVRDSWDGAAEPEKALARLDGELRSRAWR
jgi:hypothetical protein